MKDDAPAPEEIPTKRRQLRDVPDYWLAVWAGRGNLTRGERERVEGERNRRKKLRGESSVVVGVCVGIEGATPEQSEYIRGYVTAMEPAAVVHAGVSAKLLRALEPTHLHHVPDYVDVVRKSTVVVAAVKEPTEPTKKSGVWGAVKYARHRRVPVRIVLPNGMEG